MHGTSRTFVRRRSYDMRDGRYQQLTEAGRQRVPKGDLDVKESSDLALKINLYL